MGFYGIYGGLMGCILRMYMGCTNGIPLMGFMRMYIEDLMGFYGGLMGLNM